MIVINEILWSAQFGAIRGTGARFETIQHVNQLLYARHKYQISNRDIAQASPPITAIQAVPHKTDRKALVFAELLDGQRKKGCKDPRDNIYTILGIVDSEISRFIVTDYSQSVRWTYIQAVKAYITVHRDPGILYYNMYANEHSLYPSWCPDW